MSGTVPLRVVDPPVENESPPRRQAPESFELAFRRHYRFTLQMLRQYGVAAHGVDDAAQEVFLIVHRRWNDYDGRAAFAKWLLGIVRRVAKDWRRAHARAARRRENHPGFATQVPPPHLTAETRSEFALVQRVLDDMPMPQREVLVMSLVLGMTAPEVSETLGVPLNTVYSRLRLAKKRFAARHAQLADAKGKGQAR